MAGIVLSRRRLRRASWSSWEWDLGVKKGDDISVNCDSQDIKNMFPTAVLRL
jgi:hypothetical protein